MKVEYLFSRNDKLGSRLICWAAKYEELELAQPPSHIGILINDTWVIESTFFTGVRIIPYWKWRQKNLQLHRIPCWQTNRRSKEVLATLLNVWGKGYDWKGITYFAYKYLRLILFGEKLPKQNKWQRPNKYFCTEYAALLTGEDFAMKSPAKICNEWLKELV